MASFHTTETNDRNVSVTKMAEMFKRKKNRAESTRCLWTVLPLCTWGWQSGFNLFFRQFVY